MDALASLAAATAADDWEACDAWAAARYDDPQLGIAASAVGTAVERDRARRASSIEEGTGGGLIAPQRRLFEGIVRLWTIGAAHGTVREIGADRDATYGVLVGDRIALAVSCTRSTIVASDASGASPRALRQLFAVLGSLAYTTYDGAGLGRSYDLAIGSIAHANLLSGTAPLLASRWHVDAPSTLAPWLVGDAVAVRPAGGRLALVPQVEQLEQAVEYLVKVERTARNRIDLGMPPVELDITDKLERILDKLDLLRAWGWTADVEPLRPITVDVIALLEAGASADAILARVRS